ncbi:MAG TPA: hypothetical protein VFL47_14105, partial [Flavisolibacter sp.]|nr:hypothetical protein [Flavisolibacter sp.]
MTTIRFLVCFLLLHSIAKNGHAAPPAFERTADGVIVYTDPAYTGTPRAVKLSVVREDIIRVTAAPGKTFPEFQSLVTVYPKPDNIKWDLVPSKESLSLTTKRLRAVVSLKTGAVSFFNAGGQTILAEKSPVGRSFTPAVFEGKRLYNLVQRFETTKGDARYGLGQHQDGVFNYKGHQVSFFQNNTEVAIPFLVSAKNYGILWDNYSLTTAGDI